MQRWKNILFNVSFALNCLLLFLLLFENRLSVPAWLQVAGRMHPLILHFPLVLIVLYAVAVIIHPPGKTKGRHCLQKHDVPVVIDSCFYCRHHSSGGIVFVKRRRL